MAFKGLFIGIGRYASTEISELSCARRDATALHALFMDTFGGAGELLADAEATVPAIQGAFERLAYLEGSDQERALATQLRTEAKAIPQWPST